jgi:hypothetical protein
MKKIFLVLFALFFTAGVFIGAPSTVTANIACPDGYPPQCPDDYVPDFSCILAKTVNPGGSGRVICCENKCRNDADTSSGQVDDILASYREINFFNTDILLNEKKIPNLINLAFSTVVGLAGLYALIRGIYVAGFKRPNAITSDELQKVNKELTNLLIGFVLTFSFIFIIQLVISILNIDASLTDFNINFDPGTEQTGPRIIVS